MPVSRFLLTLSQGLHAFRYVPEASDELVADDEVEKLLSLIVAPFAGGTSECQFTNCLTHDGC